MSRRVRIDVGGDPYRVLGIARDASDQEIRGAYRRLARQYHPDINDAEGTERFKEVSAAYDALSDHRRRAGHDAASPRRPDSPRVPDPPLGARREVILELTDDEALHGLRGSVQLPDGRAYEIEIPPGLRDGQHVRLRLLSAAPGAGGLDGLVLRVHVRPGPW